MKIFKAHPHWATAQSICRKLSEAGFEALLAGGCVRDALMGIIPKDFDIATSARPEEVEKLFPKTVGVGKSFGVMLVVEEGMSFEVATFRSDGDYADGRRPMSIEFSTVEEDAQRRDFTINAMYFDPLREEVIDLVGGRKDLERRILRTVGQPRERFAEDHLRILRAIRFSSQLGVTIEPETWKAVMEGAGTVRTVSKERVTEELSRTWTTPRRAEGLEKLAESALLRHLLPELDEAWRGLSKLEKQGALRLFGSPPKEEGREVLWALCFLMKPEEAKTLFLASRSRLSLSKQSQKTIQYLLERLFSLFDPSLRMGEKLEWLGGEFGLELVRVAEVWVQESRADEEMLVDLMRRLTAVLTPAGTLPAPWVTGDDLIQLGMQKGPRMGALLKDVFYGQLEGRLTSREQSLEYLKKV